MMTPKEFRDTGILMELNRIFLHPLGFAAALHMDTDDEIIISLLQTDDPEGWIFVQEQFPDAMGKHAKFNEFQEEQESIRRSALGYNVQPIENLQAGEATY